MTYFISAQTKFNFRLAFNSCDKDKSWMIILNNETWFSIIELLNIEKKTRKLQPTDINNIVETILENFMFLRENPKKTK